MTFQVLEILHTFHDFAGGVGTLNKKPTESQTIFLFHDFPGPGNFTHTFDDFAGSVGTLDN